MKSQLPAPFIALDRGCAGDGYSRAPRNFTMLQTREPHERQPFSGFAIEHAITVAGPQTLPVLAEHRLKIHASRPVRGTCSHHRFLYTRGDIDIQPAGYFDTWQEFQPGASLIIHVPDRLLRFAAEDMGLDPDTAKLDCVFQLRDPCLEHIAWALEADRQARQPNGSLFSEGLGLALAVHLLGNYRAGASRIVSDAPPLRARGLSAVKLKRLHAYIDEHLDQQLSIDQLAAVVSMSPSHLKLQFKRATGMAVHEYVIRQRVERAKSLLSHSDMSIGLVALEAGFAHQSHLARAMRRVLGVTPGMFRKSQGARS
jgi:AraC family transcriptional regulator